ncbi:MarR family transcriptional regulator [Microbacterium sp. RURRCA19A]|uniref:arsenate reductase/protein-tyrosine-phosphatase family protein n=1 Tax=Microbacterium sp. RURRCA19A TaxID=1907391 RepID=UPI0009559140|nr:MarR family transcriptional regulator [Microbacterium sp. RURRCA19A]SIR58295.1 Protein-tyrosine-phosphatase [Microbacterium sp. RURRCA19A]
MSGPSLELRAARHAALADPARLRLVDALALGDRAPHELGERLGLASNLLAHHLKVLETSGLIERRRSEGDGRRSYVRLVTDAMPAEASDLELRAPRVLFVCTANSARSQLAEHVWRAHTAIDAASAGTLPTDGVAPGAVAVAATHGLDLSQAHPKMLDDIAHPDDLRITVCDRARESVASTDLHWSIPDPVRVGTRDAFAAAFDEISRRIDALLPHVRAA